ncbi:cysteine and tyrosine-rich protein 1-like isoform X2 [Dreissena polymorpha]|uniref:cysteine and tyrosine-rich protein 1-like isoform X2 n=1 Tax=Dreissena polymorpha TaxID=45954 RepID=UPI002264B8E3|nr:cysteine and tyrosine-rich protein 1-like isoform X2 [Dreissena polymorpha]
MLSLKCLVLLLIAEVYAETCSSYYGGIYTYCESGTYCCYDDTRCCSALSSGGIAGIVIGIISSITICVVICVCCYRRRNAAPGQVLQPNAGTQMVISSVNQQNTTVAAPHYPAQYPAQYPYPAYPQGHQQPQYPGHQQPPTQYQAAYPPPAYNYGQPPSGQDVPPALPAKMR